MMLISVLKLVIILIFGGWASLWVLKPTLFWTRKWKQVQQHTSASVFGDNGLAFVVYTFPLVAMAIITFIYLHIKTIQPLTRQVQRRTSVFTSFSSPLIVNKYTGVLTGAQILISSLFIMLLIWTFYTRVSQDLRKITPLKSFKLSPWEYKVSRMATRCGLLAEACLALLLLPVLRGMSVFRPYGIQFEASVRYHIWLGTSMILFATLHGAGTFFIWGINHKIQDEMWKWQKKGRIYLAGEITLSTALIIWITALPQIRRRFFQLFYYTHHLYIIFLLFFLFHAGDRHFYMVFPGVFLFALDKILRFIQSATQTCILSARVFPCKAIELTMPKDQRLEYIPTSIVFLKIPSISVLQWHPFSITSSSRIDKHTISVIVKSEGQWTRSLYNKIQDSESECIPVALEGPYGPASMEFARYDNLVMVAGGIGVTPFLSILRELSETRIGYEYPHRIELIYAIKRSQDACLLEPILPQLLDTKQFHIKLQVFVTQEYQTTTATSLKQLLIPDSEEARITNFSTRDYAAAYGPERLLPIAAITMFSSIIFLLSLLFFNHLLAAPKEKKSSSQIDLLFLTCFGLAIIFAALVAVLISRKRVKKEAELIIDGQKSNDCSVEASQDMDEHKILFGGRPNFEDILSNLTGGPETGVLICGPESMKESVAIACRNSNMSFHSLNFTL